MSVLMEITVNKLKPIAIELDSFLPYGGIIGSLFKLQDDESSIVARRKLVHEVLVIVSEEESTIFNYVL